MSTELFAGGHLAAYAAERFPCNTKVRGDHVLWNTLEATGVIINLVAGPEIILQRTSGENGSRPLLNTAQPLERIKELQKFRKPFYDRAADITINTSKLSIDITADKIIDRLKKYEGFNL